MMKPTQDSDHLEALLAELPMESPSADTSAAIRQTVMADLRPAGSRSAAGRAGLVMLTGALGVVGVVASYGRPGLPGSHQQMTAAVVSGLMVVLAGLALGGAISPGTIGLPSRRSRGVLVAGLVAAWTLFVFINAATSGGEHECPNSPFSCVLRSLAAGVLIGGAWLWLWRRTDPWTPRVGGALIGACAGCIASAGVGVACLTTATQHLVIGHLLAVPVLAIAGVLVARRFLAP
ncbi:MAG: hypothetical protein DRI90_07885 [Deltaproteobacteria bacterium]|nr:MAG: hypothetical protein DRI90_07885 [Deltaproteobacteria bacterium]